METSDPALDAETFHVLKWFHTLPIMGSAPVSGVAYMCGMDSSTALSCVKQLHALGFIRTVGIAPGEWNGEYAITAPGRDYVLSHAT
jgi:DNA-binding IclR family transcriptional regulator